MCECYTTKCECYRWNKEQSNYGAYKWCASCLRVVFTLRVIYCTRTDRAQIIPDDKLILSKLDIAWSLPLGECSVLFVQLVVFGVDLLLRVAHRLYLLMQLLHLLVARNHANNILQNYLIMRTHKNTSTLQHEDNKTCTRKEKDSILQYSTVQHSKQSEIRFSCSLCLSSIQSDHETWGQKRGSTCTVLYSALAIDWVTTFRDSCSGSTPLGVRIYVCNECSLQYTRSLYILNRPVTLGDAEPIIKSKYFGQRKTEVDSGTRQESGSSIEWRDITVVVDISYIYSTVHRNGHEWISSGRRAVAKTGYRVVECVELVDDRPDERRGDHRKRVARDARAARPERSVACRSVHRVHRRRRELPRGHVLLVGRRHRLVQVAAQHTYSTVHQISTSRVIRAQHALWNNILYSSVLVV